LCWSYLNFADRFPERKDESNLLHSKSWYSKNFYNHTGPQLNRRHPILPDFNHSGHFGVRNLGLLDLPGDPFSHEKERQVQVVLQNILLLPHLKRLNRRWWFTEAYWILIKSATGFQQWTWLKIDTIIPGDLEEKVSSDEWRGKRENFETLW
jgi:hypothetical protein